MPGSWSLRPEALSPAPPLFDEVLESWHFPEGGTIYFEPKRRDLVINGKLRSDRGQGLRALTHAAFTIGLMEFCDAEETLHPGFVVLDCPLLSYRAPSGTEDDLKGTDVDKQFFAHLMKLPLDQQVIIIDNIDPPADVAALPQAQMFSRNPHSGRYGFFPHAPSGSDE